MLPGKLPFNMETWSQGGLRYFVIGDAALEPPRLPLCSQHSKAFSLVDHFAAGVDRMRCNFEPRREQRGNEVNSPMFTTRWLSRMRSRAASSRLRDTWPGAYLTLHRAQIRGVSAVDDRPFFQGIYFRTLG